MDTKKLSLLCFLLFWKAQKDLTEHHTNHKLDKIDDDPLKYTTLKTFCFLPALLGICKLLFNEEKFAQFWAKLVDKYPFEWFWKRMYMISMSLYFSVGFSCLSLDLLKGPKWLYKYKIQKDAEIDYSTALPKLFFTLGLNLCLPMFLEFIPNKEKLCYPIVNTFMSKIIRLSKTLPSIWEITRDYWIFLCTYDILFFYSHWALHSKLLYSWIHKKHHEWKSPTALAAAYAHPIEHLLSNIAPALVATQLSAQPPHVITFALYTYIGLCITLAEHSGYEFIDTSSFHNIHHRTFTSNFGVSGVFDELHGTRVYGTHEIEQKQPI